MTTWPRMLRGQALSEVWLLGPKALDFLFVLIVGLSWVDPLFGHAAGFRSVIALPGERTSQKVEHANPRLPEELQNGSSQLRV